MHHYLKDLLVCWCTSRLVSCFGARDHCNSSYSTMCMAMPASLGCIVLGWDHPADVLLGLWGSPLLTSIGLRQFSSPALLQLSILFPTFVVCSLDDNYYDSGEIQSLKFLFLYMRVRACVPVSGCGGWSRRRLQIPWGCSYNCELLWVLES